MYVDSATQDVLDDLAGAANLARSGEAIAARTGMDAGAVVGVLTELDRIGWVFGGPDYWQLTGVGHSHTSQPAAWRPPRQLTTARCAERLTGRAAALASAQTLTVGTTQAISAFVTAAIVFVALLLTASMVVSSVDNQALRSIRMTGPAVKRWSGFVLVAVRLWFVVLAALPSPILVP